MKREPNCFLSIYSVLYSLCLSPHLFTIITGLLLLYHNYSDAEFHITGTQPKWNTDS
jgi:hypothetical protein